MLSAAATVIVAKIVRDSGTSLLFQFLPEPIGNTRTRVERFATCTMTNHHSESFASPSSTRCSNFGGVPGCQSFARCETR